MTNPERDALKQRAQELGIEHAPSVPTAKLAEMVAEAQAVVDAARADSQSTAGGAPAVDDSAPVVDAQPVDAASSPSPRGDAAPTNPTADDVSARIEAVHDAVFGDDAPTGPTHDVELDGVPGEWVARVEHAQYHIRITAIEGTDRDEIQRHGGVKIAIVDGTRFDDIASRTVNVEREPFTLQIVPRRR
jgi:hypothetical protein